MASIACTRKDVTLTMVQGGSRYYGPTDLKGDELPDIQMTVTDEPNQRVYYCRNCMEHFDGSVSFDEVKQHLGTFPVDEPKHPF